MLQKLRADTVFLNHASALGGKDVNHVARGLQQVEGLLTIKILLFVAILTAWIPYIPPLNYQ
jgi:hypothetical protein